MVKLTARGTDGVVCIHNGNDDVVDDPYLDLSRVLFHSSLRYPAVVDTQTGSTAMASVAVGAVRSTTYRLFEHGRPGIPMVLGYLTNFGNGRVPLAGSVATAIVSKWSGRFVTLGADATHVILHEFARGSGSTALGAQTMQWSVSVFDVDLTVDADDPAPHRTETIRIVPDRVVFSRGKFDSDRRYIRATASGVPMPKEATIKVYGAFDDNTIGWQYAMDGLVVASGGTPVEAASTRVMW